MSVMSKKKPIKTLYVDIPARTKDRLQRLADYNGRKLNREVTLALDRYIAEEEAKAGLDSEEDDE